MFLYPHIYQIAQDFFLRFIMFIEPVEHLCTIAHEVVLLSKQCSINSLR